MPKKNVFLSGKASLGYPCMEGLHFSSRSTIVCSFSPVTAGHGRTNCDILASGIWGYGDGKRKWERKFHQQGLKMVISHWIRLKVDQIGQNIDQKGLKIVFLYPPKNLFFEDILFAKHFFSEEIILSEISLRGSPAINFAPLQDEIGSDRRGDNVMWLMK